MADFPEFHVEPNWKELAQRYREERDQARKEVKEWRRQCAELTKRLGDQVTDEKPCFMVLPGPHKA